MIWWYTLRGVLKYTVLGPFHWTATILSFLIVPFIVPLASADGWLPRWLSWFQTLDNSLDGDHGWQAEHRLWLEVPYDQLNVWQRYINRVLWLYRNPVYGLEKTVLCAEIDPGSTRWLLGADSIGGIPFKPGKQFCVIRTSQGKCYAEWAHCIPLSDTKQWSVMIGWKLTFAGDPALRTDIYKAQIVTTCRINAIT